MKSTWLILTLLLIFLSETLLAVPPCVPRKQLRDRHVVTYQAYNGTLRGCVVTPNFYTQQHKQGRGKLSRLFIVEICEGEPRTSPRIGDSFEICPYRRTPDPKQSED